MNSLADTVDLHNGVAMPWFGLGVFRAEEGKPVRAAVRHAIDAGYRSIDTASIYGNERGVGEAVRAADVPRGEIFVTTKLWNADHGFDPALHAFDESLDKLGMDCVDLYLVHWPVPGRFVETWRAMERIYHEGRARAIGVSNFLVHHLDELLADVEVVPMVNQVEFHPRLQSPALLDHCERHRIRVEAWSPIMRGAVTEISELRAIADAHGKNPVQIVLRWDLQRGVVTIPKSTRPDRIVGNAEIFDFELSDDEMSVINGLDRNERDGPDPDNFKF